MSISICSDEDSWINSYIPELILDFLSMGHNIRWSYSANDIPKGDICFYLSYGKIVDSGKLSKHKNNLVVHESDLPKGKGWSPMTWQVLEGSNKIPVTLFEAADAVDSGDIYLQEWIELSGEELVDDLRYLQAKATNELCRKFVLEYPPILKTAKPQKGEPTYYSKRKPVDSKLDPDQTIKSQFNLFRVVDNDKYPAFFEIDGFKYRLSIRRNS